MADTTDFANLGFYADLTSTPSNVTGAELAVVSIATLSVEASWLYDSKLKKLFALPVALGETCRNSF